MRRKKNWGKKNCEWGGGIKGERKRVYRMNRKKEKSENIKKECFNPRFTLSTCSLKEEYRITFYQILWNSETIEDKYLFYGGFGTDAQLC